MNKPAFSQVQEERKTMNDNLFEDLDHNSMAGVPSNDDLVGLRTN